MQIQNSMNSLREEDWNGRKYISKKLLFMSHGLDILLNILKFGSICLIHGIDETKL